MTRKIESYRVRISFDSGVLIYVKQCCCCKNFKNLNKFVIKNDRNIDGSHYCKDCDSERHIKYYHDNLERMRVYRRTWAMNKRGYTPNNAERGRLRNDTRAWLKKLKSDNPCMDCGYSFPWVAMDFDHARGDKKYPIAAITDKSISQEEIMEELYKCDLVCANCHRVRTNRRIHCNRVY